MGAWFLATAPILPIWYRSKFVVILSALSFLLKSNYSSQFVPYFTPLRDLGKMMCCWDVSVLLFPYQNNEDVNISHSTKHLGDIISTTGSNNLLINDRTTKVKPSSYLLSPSATTSLLVISTSKPSYLFTNPFSSQPSCSIHKPGPTSPKHSYFNYKLSNLNTSNAQCKFQTRARIPLYFWNLVSSP